MDPPTTPVALHVTHAQNSQEMNCEYVKFHPILDAVELGLDYAIEVCEGVCKSVSFPIFIPRLYHLARRNYYNLYPHHFSNV